MRIGSIGRAALLVAMVGLGAATAVAHGILPVTHHVITPTSTSTSLHTASLINFGGNGSSGPTNVPVSHTGIANLGLGLNAPALGLSTTTVGAHLPGVLGLSGHSASSGGPTLLSTGTLNLGLGLNLPLLDLSQVKVVAHVPSVTHLLGSAVTDVHGLLYNPLGTLLNDVSALLGTVGGVLYGLSGFLNGAPVTLSL